MRNFANYALAAALSVLLAAQSALAGPSSTSVTYGPASATRPGIVTTGAQTFAGAKTFSTPIAVDSGGTGGSTLDGAGIVTKAGAQTVSGAKTFSAKVAIAKSQAGLTTLGNARLLDIQNTNGSAGERVEEGWGYMTGATYPPVVTGHVPSSVAGFTKGSWYVATRDVTTDTAPTERLTVEADGDVVAQTSDLIVAAAGKGLQVKEGSNAKMGRSTLVGGAVTVATTTVTAASEIFLTSQVDGGTPGWLRVSARVAGTSFTITSSSGTDTSTVAWFIVEPSP